MQQADIGRQARHDIADARRFKIAGRKSRHVVEKTLAQIRRHTLPQPGHQIEARGSRRRQRRNQRAHHQRGAIKRARPAGKAIINQMPEPLAKREGQPSGQQQRRNRGHHARQIRLQERQQQPKGG